MATNDITCVYIEIDPVLRYYKIVALYAGLHRIIGDCWYNCFQIYSFLKELPVLFVTVLTRAVLLLLKINIKNLKVFHLFYLKHLTTINKRLH